MIPPMILVFSSISSWEKRNPQAKEDQIEHREVDEDQIRSENYPQKI